MNEIEHIIANFADLNNLVIFDIGACDFSDSISFKRAFPNSTVYAFEPDRHNLINFSESAINSGIQVIPFALSDENGVVTFYPSDNLNGKEWKYSGSLLKPIVKPGTQEGINHAGLIFDTRGYDVPIKKLSTFCDEEGITKVDYIHIDVQGAEIKVLSALEHIRPKLIFAETCEFDTYDTGITLSDFDKFMEASGYNIHTRYQYDTLYIHK